MFFRILFFALSLTVALSSCGSAGGSDPVPPHPGQGGGTTTVPTLKKTYNNPVIRSSVPDPTVIKAADGFFYLYGTEDIRNVPVFRSKDLVKWTQIGTAFNNATRPSNLPARGMMWAPDINFIGGRYVLYTSIGVWGDDWANQIRVATADKPAGPFTDRGIVIDRTQEVANSIDQFFIQDGGKNYMFWGSFHGIYGIELSEDGLSIKPGAEKVQVAGTQMEGTYIHKRGRYYYLFGSAGSCCEGNRSTYHVVYGRSENLFGPYVTKDGRRMLDGASETMLSGNNLFAGPGHNAEFITDDKGQTWMLYHAFDKKDPDNGRQVMLDPVMWADDWPYIQGGSPSYLHEAPVFNAQ